MGLDISAYGKLKPAPDAKVDEDGYPVEYHDYVRFKGYLLEYTEQNFPGRTVGVVADTIFKIGERHDFRAGAYSSYNAWRDWLARLAGYGSAQGVWSGVTEGPFVELINFSDCEGVIGPVVAAKLAKDFAEYEAKAEGADSPPYYIDIYRDFRKAFEIAADGGAVQFH